MLGQQVRECLARLSRTAAIGVNGTDDVGDLRDLDDSNARRP
jgi:hypothetical protein